MIRTFDNLELTPVSGGRLWIDGGNMFGVVPKAVWQRFCAPDERNRILLETNCLLVRRGGKLILIDTGYGSKVDEKSRANFSLDEGNPLLRSLASVGVSPDDVHAVVFTHLHFDHAGGATAVDSSGRLAPVFRNARHFVQKAEWEDATGGAPELAGSYFPNDFLPLEQAGIVEQVEGDAELLPGVRVRLTPGHTRGHQVIEVGDGEQRAIYLGDLCPYAAHMRAFWSMAYDQFPLQVRRNKPAVLGEAADRNHLVFFDHDPEIKAAYIRRDPKQEFAVREVVSL